MVIFAKSIITTKLTIMKNSKTIYTLLILICWCSLCCAQQKVTTNLSTKTLAVPDFNKAFTILSSTRKTYNLLNDSILKKRDHDDWINFFRIRSVKNHQLFTTNREVLNTLHSYFAQPDSLIPDEVFQRLTESYIKYHNTRNYDIFIDDDICNILIKHFEKKPAGPQNPIKLIQTWQGESLYQIWRVGHIEADRQRAYNLFKEIISTTQNGDAFGRLALDVALNALALNDWLVAGYENVAAYYEHHEMMKQYLLSNITLDPYKGLVRQMVDNVKTADERLIRNVYMKDPSIMPKEKADSLMRIIIKRNLANSRLSMNSYLRTLIMQKWVGEISMKQALSLAMKRYKKERKSIATTKYTDITLHTMLQQYTNLAYINDMAEVSEAKKRANTRLYCMDIVQAYKNRKDQQVGTGYIKSMVTLLTYDRLMKHISEQERINFLEELMITTHVSTYAHTLHVAEIAKVLMNSIINDKPELLIGTLGYKTVAQVQKARAELIDFIYHAALYHDIGKNQIISVVNNEYRPLTDHEFAIIKKHPALGIDFLKMAPNKLYKYYDTTIGHHKWYNGKGGYPAEFDNTKSRMRFLIDIVTFCDCMQAATERLGRNYKKEKSFVVLMQEFRQQAGVQINPDLVKLVDDDHEFYDKLNNLVTDGWLDIYYRIYSQYFLSEDPLESSNNMNSMMK